MPGLPFAIEALCLIEELRARGESEQAIKARLGLAVASQPAEEIEAPRMIVVNGIGHHVPGRVGESWLSDRRLNLKSQDDWRPRRSKAPVMGVVLHTRWGVPPKVKPATGPNRGWDIVLAGRFSADERKASCHVAVDADGSYGCFADLARVVTYHAGHVNGVTVGIELYQERDGTMWESTLEAGADICDVVTRVFGIQRQFPTESDICRRLANHLSQERATFVPGANRGRDFCGVYGHRNVTRNRGPGDPGGEIFEVLKARGYEPFAIDKGEDLSAWEERQRALGFREDDIDGIPGELTRARLRMQRRGGPGIWVERPGDDAFDDDGVA